MHAMACSLSDLGELSPPLFGMAGERRAVPHQGCSDGSDVYINGIRLPDSVVEELRMIGLPLSWYNKGELEDAVLACKYDNHLIDDEDGVTLRDKMTLTYEEKLTADRKRKKKPKLFLCSDENEEDDALSLRN